MLETSLWRLHLSGLWLTLYDCRFDVYKGSHHEHPSLVTMYDNFTALPKRVTEASSIPQNVFRNRERYQLEDFATSSNAGLYNIRADAWISTVYAKDRLLEDAVPSYLLHDYIIQNHLLCQSQSYPVDPSSVSLPAFRHSTVAACHHENRSLVIHSGGKAMNELILRDSVRLFFSNAELLIFYRGFNSLY